MPRGKPATMANKVQALTLHRGGLSYRAIAKQLGFARSSIMAWCKNESVARAAEQQAVDAMRAERGAGRPSIVGDQEIRERLVRAMASGASDHHVARYARISPQTLVAWRAKAKEGDEHFSAILARAEEKLADKVIVAAENVRDGVVGNRSMATWLAAVDRQRFGPRQTLDLSVNSGVEDRSDEELALIAGVTFDEPEPGEDPDAAE